MKRREFAALLTALAAAKAQTPTTIPSKVYPFDDLPVKANGANKSRAVFNGVNRSGFPLEVHETELGPGGAPHPPHRHLHEEMLVVLDGTVAFTVNGAITKLSPGSVAYAASNDLHGPSNPTDKPCRYLVVTIGRDN